MDPASRPDVLRFAEDFMTKQDPGTYGYDSDMLAARVAAEWLTPLEAKPGLAKIRQFILKVVADCNFRCKYPCYEYMDNSWRLLPAVMGDEVLVNSGRQIGKYAAAVGLGAVEVIFHGGEPLFMHKPEEYYDRAIPLLKQHIQEASPDTKIRFGMQTNGALLRPAILDVLKKHEVSIGVSLDGDEAAHDAYRRTKVGDKPTHELVLRGLAQLAAPEYRDLARSLLCVINIDSDPLVVYDFLREHAPPGIKYIDFILPYATHDEPPRQPADPAKQSPTPYADWLMPIYWESMRRDGPPIRLFRSIMGLALGGRSGTEAVGPDAGGELIIRSDGRYELVDALKVTGSENVSTSMGVDTHGIEEVAQLLRQTGHLGKKTVAAACQPCSVRDICGGGHVASRYSSERGLDNPSSYCRDLKVLSTDIPRAVRCHTLVGMAHVLDQRGVAVPPKKADPATHGCTSC